MRPSRISIDSTAVIIHIVNYSAQEILVSLETGEARLPVGKVAGLQEALFVLPGDKITDLGDFAVEVTQNGLAVGRTKPVRRVPGKLARVYLILGPRPGGATSPADRLVRS